VFDAYPETPSGAYWKAVEVATCDTWVVPVEEELAVTVRKVQAAGRRLSTVPRIVRALLQDAASPTIEGNAIVWRCGAVPGATLVAGMAA
jgi:hypothetical protein